MLRYWTAFAKTPANNAWKPLKTFLIVILTIVLICIGHQIAKRMAHRHHKDWTVIQSRRCATLEELLYLFHEKHHNYPTSLHELVGAEFLTESRYCELMFQSDENSEMSEWKYHAPQDPQKFPLFSGKPITTWNCPITTYIVGGPGGEVSSFDGDKLEIYRRHYLHPSLFKE